MKDGIGDRKVSVILCFDYLINVKDYGFFEALTGGKVKWTPLKKKRTESSAIATVGQGLQPSNKVSFRTWH